MSTRPRTSAARAPSPAQAWLPDIHGGTLAPIAIASLATPAGLFTGLDARSGDRRPALAGFCPLTLLVSRLVVMALGALLETAASLAVTATVFDARQGDRDLTPGGPSP